MAALGASGASTAIRACASDESWRAWLKSLAFEARQFGRIKKLGIDDGGYNLDAKSMAPTKAWMDGWMDMYADRVPFANSNV